MQYVLDTNVFIEAKDSYYMFEVCSGFWEWLKIQNENGVVYSVSAVNDELQKGSDLLSEWAADRGDEFFLRPNESTVTSLKIVTDTLQRMNYTDQAVDTFVKSADYYIVAEAHAGKYTLVTRELQSNSRGKVKIPNICNELQIDCTGPFQMLKSENARFVLDRTPTN